MYNPSALPARFAAKIIVDQATGCWVWMGTLGKDGYGRVWFDGKQRQLVHRVVYRLLVGPIPDGLQIDHLCRNRACVNPAHMEPVTQRENILRGVSPSAIAARRTHCLRGHEYDSTTTGRGARRVRRCLTCHREYMQRARQGG